MSTPSMYRWFVSGQVITADQKGNGRQRPMNTLVSTVCPIFTRKDLATAQEGMMRRFLTETDAPKGTKIVDCFIISISNLGLMTEAEFNEGFPVAKAEPVQ